jgi:CDP-glucose 4,6-dehydratase
LGAEVSGYALNPLANPSLYEIAKVEELVTSHVVYIKDYNNVAQC